MAKIGRPRKVQSTNITLTQAEWFEIVDLIESTIDSRIYDAMDSDPIYAFEYSIIGERMLLHSKLNEKLKDKFPNAPRYQ